MRTGRKVCIIDKGVWKLTEKGFTISEKTVHRYDFVLCISCLVNNTLYSYPLLSTGWDPVMSGAIGSL